MSALWGAAAAEARRGDVIGTDLTLAQPSFTYLQDHDVRPVTITRRAFPACGIGLGGLMGITFDKEKRLRILVERQMDIADAGTVFARFHLTRRDDKHSDVEDRFISVGELHSTVVIVVWTERDGDRRIVTMWKANDRERQSYFSQRGRSGRGQART